MSQLLSTDNTTNRVNLCDWHLRKIFREERIWEKCESREFRKVLGNIRPRNNPSVRVPDAEYNQELIIFDPVADEEIARCHWFLKADRVTVAASSKPDPKEINLRGKSYHQLGKKYKICEHCAAGISTYSDPPIVPS
jgi:hypothetical protein